MKLAFECVRTGTMHKKNGDEAEPGQSKKLTKTLLSILKANSGMTRRSEALFFDRLRQFTV
jgi:hypothetical protein